MLIVSFNLGHNIQTNKVHGSEAEMVKLCQSTYNDYSTNKLSPCSYNAAQFLADTVGDHLRGDHSQSDRHPDSGLFLIGLQELVINDKWNFVDIIKQKLLKSQETTVCNLSVIYSRNTYSTRDIVKVAIIFDSDLFGYYEIVFDNKIEDTIVDGGDPVKGFVFNSNKMGRPILCVYFHKLKLIVINLHMPHFACDTLMEKFYQAIEPLKKFKKEIDRIIVMGDFNDYENKMTNLKICNKILYKNQYIKTCCFDTQYNHPGDYIFDTTKSNIKDTVVNNVNILMSDHYPIIKK